MASSDIIELRSAQISVIDIVNLSAVTSATDGDSVDMRLFDRKSVFVDVPVNTGAVTVKIEASPTGAFAGEEIELNSKTYTATGYDVFTYENYYPYMRTTTSTQSNATVTTRITGRT